MLSVVDKVLFLMRAPATAGVTTEALSRLALLAREVELPAGEALFAGGGEPEALWAVVSGAVRVDAVGGGRLAEAGELLGALALLAGAPHAAGATVVRAARLLRVERRDLELLLDEDGQFARHLFGGLVRGLLDADAR